MVGAGFRRAEPHLPRPSGECAERARELRQGLAAMFAADEQNRRVNAAEFERLSEPADRSVAYPIGGSCHRLRRATGQTAPLVPA